MNVQDGITLTVESFSHLAKDSSFMRCTDFQEQSKADKLLGGGKGCNLILLYVGLNALHSNGSSTFYSCKFMFVSRTNLNFEALRVGALLIWVRLIDIVVLILVDTWLITKAYWFWPCLNISLQIIWARCQLNGHSYCCPSYR